MIRKHNKILVPTAKELRKNMTKQEKRLWYEFLKKYPVKFQRQKVLGKYIADFYCAEASLVIELDGEQHYQWEGLLHDDERDDFLAQYGIKVIRLPNHYINEYFCDACDWIHSNVKKALGYDPYEKQKDNDDQGSPA